jgi:hypothetical protein
MKAFAFLFLLFVFATPVQAEPERLTLNKLVEQFNAVVFVHEHGKTGREEKPLIKWEKAFVYSPSGTLQREQVLKFFNLMKRIKQLTKLNMRMVQKGEKASLIINFVPQAALVKQMKPGINCFGKIGANKQYQIINGRAFIPSDRPDKTDHCLVEETVQLFGLTNDSTVLKNSMFNENSKRTSLSVSDQILLKALYDPRLKAGMTRTEAQPIVRQVIKDILEKAMKKKSS